MSDYKDEHEDEYYEDEDEIESDDSEETSQFPTSYIEESNEDSNASSDTNYYIKDVIFGNMIYKNILYEQTFSKIFNLLEFTRENRGINQKHVDDIYQHYLENPYQFIKPLDIICFTNDLTFFFLFFFSLFLS